MTLRPARWILGIGLGCLMIGLGVVTSPADESSEQSVAPPVPMLMPFAPAYRSRPPRQPADLPATSSDDAEPVEQTATPDEDQSPGEQDDHGAEHPLGDLPMSDAQPDDAPEAETTGAEDGDEQPEAEPAAPIRELSPALAKLRDRVRSTLSFHRKRPLSAASNSTTEILAACLAFGCETNILRGNQRGKTVNGITQICWNYPCNGYAPLVLADGHIAGRLGYGQQEHRSQLLATLALSRVKAEYPMRVGEEVRSVADLVEGEKLRCRADADLSLTLVGLAYYVGGNDTWTSLDGQEWSVGRIIQEELDKPVVTATDGGLNRLMGLSYAVHRRKKDEKPVEGQYLRAENFVRQFHDYALKLQNSDGSWGPWFLSARGSSRDAVENLRGTGHVLEWLAISLPDEELEDSRVIRAVDYVVTRLSGRRYARGAGAYSTREIDSVMHALHALVVYDERVFQPADPPPAKEEAPAESEDAEKPEDAEKVAHRPE